MFIRIINTALLALAALALASCAGLTNPGGEESFADMAMPAGESASLTPEQHQRIGDGYVEQGEQQQAYMHYSRALAAVDQNGPDGLTLRVKCGLLILSQGLEEQALVQFQKVLAIDPNHALGNQAAGEVYLRSGLTIEAKEHLDRALENDPYLWKAHHLLGMLHSRENRFEQAVEEFQSALALSSDQAETLNNLGVAQLAQGRYAAALQAFQRALKTGAPKEKTYNNIGLALARMGRDREALEAFRYAGDEAKAYNNLGYVMLLMGDTQRAVTCFEKAVQVSPSYYSKAFENLKQARMAEQFRQAGLDRSEPQLSEPASFSPADAKLAPDPRPLTQSDLAVEPTPEPVVEQAAEPVVEETVVEEPVAEQAPEQSPDQNADADQNQTQELASPASAPILPESPAEPAVLTMPGASSPAALALAEASFTGAPATSRALTLNNNTAEVSEATSGVSSGPIEPGYGLHVSSFKTLKRANKEIERLSSLGLEASIMAVDLGDKGQWYRVLAGRYPTRADAKKAAPQTASLLGLDQLPIIEFKEPPLSMPPSESAGLVL